MKATEDWIGGMKFGDLKMMIDGKQAEEITKLVATKPNPRTWKLEWKDGPGGFTQWWIDGPPSSEQHEIVEVIELIKP